MIINRELTTQLNSHLNSDKIIILIGPRQAGKTTLLTQVHQDLVKQKKPVSFLTLEDPTVKAQLNHHPDQLFELLTITPSKLHTVLIDEIQYLSDPSNFLKYHYDLNRNRVKLVVAGSSAFYLDKKFKDSLVGRKVLLYVPTLSFADFLNFKQASVLAQRLNEELKLLEQRQLGLLYQEYLIYGGYPEVVLSEIAQKLTVLRDIAYSYIKKDILEARLTQDETYYQLLKTIAAQTGQLLNEHALSQSLGVSKTLVHDYLYVMQKSFHLHLIRPFQSTVKKELRKMPKAYFLDTGLRNVLLDTFDPLSQRSDKGELLENGVMRSLYDLDPSQSERIRFWRTQDQQEVDFVYQEQFALECKYTSDRYNPKKSARFTQSYNLPIQVVSLEGKHPHVKPWQLAKLLRSKE